MGSNMDIEHWQSQMQSALDDFEKVELLYPKNAHVIHPPAKESDLELLRAAVKPAVPLELEQFYRVCDGVSLPDIHNGYSIESARDICKYIAQGEPTSISDGVQRQVVTFGWNGGGGRFVLCTDGPPDVLYLPDWGGVDDGVFDAGFAPPRLIATSFAGFLARLLEDVQAFVRGDDGWEFMGDCPK